MEQSDFHTEARRREVYWQSVENGYLRLFTSKSSLLQPLICALGALSSAPPRLYVKSNR